MSEATPEKPFETQELEPVLEPIAPEPTPVRTYGQQWRITNRCC